MISKAVIAAGGWSTRFLPTVKVYAKQLVPILNKPQIQWVVEELVGAGITDICLVHREGEETLNQYFSPDTNLDAYLNETGKQSVMDSYNQMMSKVKSITFLPQTKAFPYGNGSPILVAKEFIDNDPFVYLWGDDLTIEANPGNFLTNAINKFETYHAAAVEGAAEVPWSEVYRYGTFEFSNDPQYPNRISSLKEKLPEGQAPSNIIQGGRMVVSPKIISVLENTAVSKGELWFTDAINTLAKEDVVMIQRYEDNGATWMTTGDPQNWFKANLTLAKNHPDFQKLL